MLNLKNLFKNKIFKVVAAGGLAAAFAFILWGNNLVAFAQNIIDSFTDTSKVGVTWNVEVDTSAGKIKLAEKTCDDGVWNCAASTTCSNLMGDGDYIIVADANISGSKTWKTSQTNCDQPQCGQDGAQSDDNLLADNTINYSLYPARDACKSIGGRLPNITELGCIYTNRVTFGNNFGTGYYWSRTEYSETYARFVYFFDGGAYSNTKTNAYSVRCVRGW